MSKLVAPLRIGIGQLQMRWSLEENTSAIVRALGQAASHGARLCVFPELALTGFHRQIAREAQAQPVAAALASVCEASAHLAVAVAVGAPTFGHSCEIFNSQVFISESGKVLGSVEKNGITPAEATFFVAGSGRPSFELCGERCTSVLCREIEDEEHLASQLLPGSVEYVFWPGIIRPPVGSPDTVAWQAVEQAQRLAARLNAFVVQANWPNSLNYPEESRHAGQSSLIAPSGAVLLRLPVGEAGVGVFTCGESSYEWLPEVA